MLSFDISDRQINIVKGDNSSNKIRIERSLQVDVPEDMILNGEVINLSGLADLLMTQIKAEDMLDKDAIVTFSSSNIVFKELVVPKAKGNEFLLMVQNHMSQEMGITDEYSISYTVVGEAGEDNPGAVKVLATACPSSIVESYRKLFNIMSMNLRSVNIGCNSIARIVLADKSNMEKMPLLVCQIDKNFLGLTLFENGQMAFARYVPISEEDYDSDDYITEALNENIFRMEQFNKARGGSGLENVILYGFIEDYIKLVDALDGLDIKASVLGVPAQITGFENFEFTVFANAIGALYKRNKATEKINLLEVDQSTGKGSGSGMGSLLITGGVFVAAAAVIIAGATLIINIRKNSIQDDIDKTNQEIAVCNEKIAQNQVLHNKKQIMQEYSDYVNAANASLETLPVVSSSLLDTIEEALGSFEYKGFAFDLDAGTVTLSQVTLNEQSDVTKAIESLVNTGLFQPEVGYTGYSINTEGGSSVVLDSLVLYLKDVGE
ncbi:pilus assembly protein PilM [Ruminococcus sp.]|uniref:pilus assembly protein PilM n=1 Tax=Ruminococcus sp. TaxID=41978 RepID=UPI0025FAA0AC|nr:pilus assembly protein PilM [Ruminococcus sp.]